MSKAKGGRRERQARDLLQEKGYYVEKSINHQFGDNDYFNLFDLMAVRPGSPVKFVQVKSNSTGGELEHTAQQATLKLPNEHTEVEFWICYDREGWRIQRLHPVGQTEWDWELVLDERDVDKNMGEYVLSEY